MLSLLMVRMETRISISPWEALSRTYLAEYCNREHEDTIKCVCVLIHLIYYPRRCTHTHTMMHIYTSRQELACAQTCPNAQRLSPILDVPRADNVPQLKRGITHLLVLADHVTVEDAHRNLLRVQISGEEVHVLVPDWV